MLNYENPRVADFFDFDTIDRINKYISNPNLSDNNKKGDALLKNLLEPLGFYEVGMGTNRLIVSHPDYEDLVFKIALDQGGLRGNAAEYVLSPFLCPRDIDDDDLKEGEEIAPILVTETLCTNNTIAVAERGQRILSQPEIQEFIDSGEFQDVIDTLIENGYIINDIGPAYFLNYVTGMSDDNEGRLLICDYEYITPLTEEIEDNLFCDKCMKEKGLRVPLNYNVSFTKFVCPECEALYPISSKAPTIKTSIDEEFEDDFYDDDFYDDTF